MMMSIGIHDVPRARLRAAYLEANLCGGSRVAWLKKTSRRRELLLPQLQWPSDHVLGVQIELFLVVQLLLVNVPALDLPVQFMCH